MGILVCWELCGFQLSVELGGLEKCCWEPPHVHFMCAADVRGTLVSAHFVCVRVCAPPCCEDLVVFVMDAWVSTFCARPTFTLCALRILRACLRFVSALDTSVR